MTSDLGASSLLIGEWNFWIRAGSFRRQSEKFGSPINGAAYILSRFLTLGTSLAHQFIDLPHRTPSSLYGADRFDRELTNGYLGALLGNARVARFLAQH